MSFLYGVEVIEINDGPGPISVVRSSVIGLIGTAPSLPVLPSGIDIDTGTYQGISAFLASDSELGFTPRILIALEFSQVAANTNDAEAIEFRDNFGSDRLYIVDPWVRVFNSVDEVEEIQPASARVAGLIAKSDAENGFWWSPSNQELRGILGTARPIDFALGDPNTRANLLNEKEVTTIIRKTGYRLWGNRTASADPKFAFLSVRRTADIINGRAWADPELNTPYPAERITFRSRLVNDYLTEVLPTGT